MKELLSNVGSGGGAPAAGSAPAASSGGAAAEAPKVEEKVEEKEESDDDMVRIPLWPSISLCSPVSLRFYRASVSSISLLFSHLALTLHRCYILRPPKNTLERSVSCPSETSRPRISQGA